jgi:galactokinase
MQAAEMQSAFLKAFGGNELPRVFFCPGRVNLIGEHIDYNGGYVFPSALTLGIWMAIRKRSDSITNIQSLNGFPPVQCSLNDELTYDEKWGWGNYPIGVGVYLINEGFNLEGYDILYYGNLPDGAGLSSSAAIEVLTAYAFLSIEKADNIDKVWLAKFCQKVENHFVGVNCGIMDQFSVALGQKEHAILLDCNSLQYDYIPLNLGHYSLVIMNTKKRRELAESKYNERRAECDAVLDILRQYFLIEDLCSAGIESINKLVTDPILKRRASHVINENLRVKKAVEVLKQGNLKYFGMLLNDSHRSLRDDYEVTGFELDTIVAEAQDSPYCLGARMTGAGFGGCAIALVQKANFEKFIEQVGTAYTEATSLTPEFYISDIGDGVRELT